MNEPTRQDIQQAYQRIQKYIHRTPLLSNRYIDKICGASVHFKCQNLQKTGSFKVRGAANKILQLQKPSILCAHSSGNHAQAVAYIAKRLGLKAYIVMPVDTPAVKKNAVKGYQALVFESGPTAAEQQAMSSKLAIQHKADFIHPYNDWQILTGGGTAAYEIYQDHKDLDFLVVPIGGGGLMSGSLLATKYFSPHTKVIGVEPFLARDAKDSLDRGILQPQYPPYTLAQGVRTNIGTITFEVLRKYLTDIILVQEHEMIEASLILQQRMKMVVELSGALVLAAIIKDDRFRGKKVACILSGGNMDLSAYFTTVRSSL